MTDMSHLDALQSRLSRETARFNAARTENERGFRQREMASCAREIANEYRFLGIEPLTLAEVLMSDDELLAALGA